MLLLLGLLLLKDARLASHTRTAPLQASRTRTAPLQTTQQTHTNDQHTSSSEQRRLSEHDTSEYVCMEENMADGAGNQRISSLASPRSSCLRSALSSARD